MLRISLALMFGIFISNNSYAEGSTLSPHEAKNSVCKVMVAVLYNFGKSYEPGIDMLSNPGKGKNQIRINPEFIESIESASATYKNLDCDKVLNEQK